VKTFDTLKKKSDNLTDLVIKLDKHVSEIKANLTKIRPAVEKAAQIFVNLEDRTGFIQQIAENVTMSTQDLYDDANNALDSLKNINKSVSSNFSFMTRLF